MHQNNEFIHVSIDGRTKKVNKGISLLELSKITQRSKNLDVLAAKVDNKIQDLRYQLEKDCKVEFIDLSSDDGSKIYKRSLFFILTKTVKEIFPERKLNIRHSLSRGTYCEIIGEKQLLESEVNQLEEKMKDIVSQNTTILRQNVSVQEAREIFRKTNDYEKISLLKHYNKESLSLYSCGNLESYLYGCLVPDTGYLKKFELLYYKEGFILRYPDQYSPNDIPTYEENNKLFQVINEYKRWGEILNVSHIGCLNEIIATGKAGDLIRVSEALHEKKIANIADMIKAKENDLKIVLISGPSSSGKTTFAKRLAIHLRVNGLRPVTISLDDYFVDRELTPKDENGEYDFEAVEAIDIELFNQHLCSLVNGEEVEIPTFNFHQGKRELKGKKLQLDTGGIMIVEGIHGLNERLTFSIPKKNKFKIYVSALTQLSRDGYNPISTTDNRLIRRMVRDFNFRSNSPLRTLKMWPSVRRGEMKNIFPFQEQADVMFNSALVYELAVLKDYVVPLLERIESTSEYYSEARRIISFLRFFLPISPEEIPNTSIMREFIGGSALY